MYRFQPGRSPLSDSDRNLCLQEGDVLFQEGSSGEFAYLIQSGEFEITVMRGGTRFLLNIIGPGELVGEMALLDNGPRTATVTARTAGEVLAVPRQVFEERLVDADPVLAHCTRQMLRHYRENLAAAAYLVPQPNNRDRAPRTTQTEPALAQVETEGLVQNAITRGELAVVFQPIVDFGSGRPLALEALVRWHPKGAASDDARSLILAAAYSGLYERLTRFVLREALAQLPRLQSAFMDRRLSVSVNVTASDLADPHCVTAVIDALDEARIDPTRLILEVTGQHLHDAGIQAAQTIREARDAGLRIALDDFGSEQTGLALLRDGRFDQLKIDRSFIEALDDGPAVEPLLRHMLGLARDFELLAIAEGVASAAQTDRLRALACPAGQGFHLGRPLPADELMLDRSA